MSRELKDQGINVEIIIITFQMDSLFPVFSF